MKDQSSHMQRLPRCSTPWDHVGQLANPLQWMIERQSILQPNMAELSKKKTLVFKRASWMNSVSIAVQISAYLSEIKRR